ncbi:MAG: hypothetical protein EHM48_03680, partial [Planctomycetaceae bacterium]
STVTITATDASAAEPSDTGTFTVTRSGYTGAALTVNYNISGTATNGTDYTTLGGTVTIPSGQTTATITVTPTDDATSESTETAIVTLASGTDYTVGSPSAATVNITDDDPSVVNMVNFGSSAGNNTFGTGWTTVFLGGYTSYVDAGPDGITGGSTGNYHCVGISGAAARQFNSGDQVTVTWYNNSASSKTFTPVISFDDLDYPGGGSDSGTWYTMSQMTIPAGTSATATYTFTSSGSYYNINTARSTNNIADVLIDKIEVLSGEPSGTTVTISATDASAAEPSNTGTYTITRSGSTSGSLAVNYTVSGTATNGTDYTSLSGSITIPDGQASTTITLTPTNDSSIEGTETAIVTLASGTGYSVGSPSGATVNIADDDVYTVTISATDAAAAEPSNTGTFTVTRAGGTSGDLVVNLSRSGTAVNGTDYNSIGTTVTIPNGQSSATITVTPIDDTTTESTETVILTLSSGSGYSVGSPSAATVNITDNDSGGVQISSVSGTLGIGQSLTISGSNFGTKTTAAPYKYDNFESGTVGQGVTGWYIGGEVVYSDAQVRTAGNADQSVYLNFNTGYNSTIGLTNLDLGHGDQVYLSGWFYHTVGGAESRNYKLLAYRGGDPGALDNPQMRVDMYPNTDTGHAYIAASDGSSIANADDWSVGGDLHVGAWHRLEVYVDLGQAGQNNGVYNGWLDGEEWWSITGVNFDVSLGTFNNIYFSHFFAKDVGTPTPTMDHYWDELYVDTTRSRVEIGNASTWAACTHREVQTPTAWSSTSITVDTNMGSFTDGTAYLYVVDANGNVNSNGYAMSVSGKPAAYDDSYSMAVNGTLTVSAAGVMANDVDPQGQSITATKLSDPSHGSVTFNSNGSFTYTPTSNYYGTDSFTYRVSDGTNTSNTATVNISVRQNVVNFGDSAGNNTFGTAWTTVFKGPYVSYSSDGPDGLSGGTTLATTYQGVSGSARTFNVGETVFVTWYNNSTAAVTFTPKISFDDPDQYAGGTSGTWYDMTTLFALAPGQTATTSYTITTGG